MAKPPRNKEPKGDYAVGYAKPPAEHQFKKGQPRPPRKSKPEKPEPTLQEYLAEELKQPMRIRENGIQIYVPKGKAVAKAAIKGAIASEDPRRLKGFLPPPRVQEDIDFSEIDLAIVKRFLADWLKQQGQAIDDGAAAPPDRAADKDDGGSEA